MTRLAAALLLLALVGVAACGDDEPEPSVKVPTWARVAPEQIAEAENLGVPVAFENDIRMRFVLIPAGTFVMGRAKRGSGDDLYDNEGPYPHTVRLTKPYYLQVMEVTNRQYRRLYPQHDSGQFNPLEGSDCLGYSLNGDKHPAVEVSHEEAVKFAGWMSTRDTGRTYRLPTEAEWEHACRAGGTGRFPWGDSEDEARLYANLDDRAMSRRIMLMVDRRSRQASFALVDDGHRVSAPVGTYRPNRWGLFDMTGNVYEWCADWFTPYSVTVPVDPTGLELGEYRAVRGGSWALGPSMSSGSRLAGAGCGDRSANVPDRGSNDIGFRLVSPLPQPKSSR